jgi:hypothetical protein
VEKPASVNLLLSGNLTAQASKEENFVAAVFPRKKQPAYPYRKLALP